MPLEKARVAGALWRNLLALAAGVACGALLASAYVYSAFGEPLVFGGLLVVMVFYGAAIAAICVPVWMILCKLDQEGPAGAAALGFIFTATLLLLTNPTTDQVRAHLMTHTILPYALCGAAGALTTWWVGRKLHEG
ncbi:hypothetical protein [Altererythrobacter sp. Root672]|uniref:hypothetical protein n=1 Tax=Altererythrobacter sp. Root672 TaxID=1736584 RepID=UPI0006F4366C|nr:hypothetical protein [Altererythrobacter sp. Root672]KRA83159.1 hypothetical protein ASD76_03555 [Altererythrobacter sp. Root672]